MSFGASLIIAYGDLAQVPNVCGGVGLVKKFIEFRYLADHLKRYALTLLMRHQALHEGASRGIIAIPFLDEALRVSLGCC